MSSSVEFFNDTDERIFLDPIAFNGARLPWIPFHVAPGQTRRLPGNFQNYLVYIGDRRGQKIGRFGRDRVGENWGIVFNNSFNIVTTERDQLVVLKYSAASRAARDIAENTLQQLH